MSPGQNDLYWREYGQMKKRCEKSAWRVPERHEIHQQALMGCDKGPDRTRCPICEARLKEATRISHTEFDGNPKQRDHFVDLLLGALRSYSQAESIGAQTRQDRQPRTRLEWKVVNEQTPLLAVLLAVLPEGKFSDVEEARINTPADLTIEDYTRAENYILELMTARFGEVNIREISAEPNGERTKQKSDLECLRDTLDARITSFRQETPWTWHALRMRAGVKCDCKTFYHGKAAPVQAEEVAA
jgi:hypothetical protein